MNAPSTTRHSWFEDAQALLVASLFIALGMSMYRSAGLLTGGTAGLAFLVHYLTHWRFGPVFFVLNLPFYWLALRVMGRAFTIKTFAAIALVSAMAELVPQVIAFAHLDALFASVMGGFLIGTGLLMLFRHRASLGGVGVMALWLQEKKGWRAGKVQMAVDCAIVIASFAVVTPWMVVVSVIGALALNLVLAINHKPGRYTGV